MPFSLALIYFIYGLAFFSLGLAMVLESRHATGLAGGAALRLLAAFGFLHGLHEWLELALGLGGEALLGGSAAGARLALLAVSFAALAGFGLAALGPPAGTAAGRPLRRGGFAVLALVLVALGVGALTAGVGGEALRYDALIRYSLAVPGAGLAAWALARRARPAGRPPLDSNAAAAETLPGAAGSPHSSQRILSRSLGLAAAGFALYGLTQLFVPPWPGFPAGLLNTSAFLTWTGVPIQAVRAALAVAITAGLLRAAGAAEDERQHLLQAARQARLDALEQVRRELEAGAALRRALLRHTVTAQEAERGRIARELHDETAQLVTAIGLHLASLQAAGPNDPQFHRKLATLVDLGGQLQDGLYRLVHDLRPAQLDDLGLAAALQALADGERRRTGLEVTLDVSGPRRRLDPAVETVLFRVAQEALSNVARHAGVSGAGLQLRFEPGQVRMQVCDAGVGFDPGAALLPPHGYGLAGMRERAEAVGAALILHSAPGDGTTVEVSVPCGDYTTKERRDTMVHEG